MPIKLRELIVMLESFPKELKDKFEKVYGGDLEVTEERRRAYLAALNRFKEVYGEKAEVVVARAPGRINIMGRHVDYMGGFINPAATSFEVIAIAQAREDDKVSLINMDPKYEGRDFRIEEEMPKEKIKDLGEWDRWTIEKARERDAKGEGFDWSDYVKGLFIYLQNYYRSLNGDFVKRLNGMNILIHGNIPQGAGMASSSSLVTAVAIAIRELNKIDIPLEDFINLVGYSEWYRLTRGGTGDHAAIMLALRGHVSHIGSLPTKLEEVSHAPFPEGYKIIVVDSGFERPRNDESLNYLRATAAEYRIALLLIKKNHPKYAERLKLLRDVNIRNLKVRLLEVYEMIRLLPEKATRKELRSSLTEKLQEELETIFMSHKEPRGGYKIRQRALYGLAEAERAYVFPKFLRRGDVEGMLELIRRSHDGDRVAKFDKDGKPIPWSPEAFSSKERLDRLILNLRKGGLTPSQIESYQLYWQPGGYERSIPPIDHMCDIIDNYLHNYAAAQLMGAGLGGSVQVVVRQDKVDELKKILADEYFERYGVRPKVTTVSLGHRATLPFP